MLIEGSVVHVDDGFNGVHRSPLGAVGRSWSRDTGVVGSVRPRSGPTVVPAEPIANQDGVIHHCR